MVGHLAVNQVMVVRIHPLELHLHNSAVEWRFHTPQVDGSNPSVDMPYSLKVRLNKAPSSIGGRRIVGHSTRHGKLARLV